ncbi:hypothetical protein H5410_063973, partial [Solanum commersonii]
MAGRGKVPFEGTPGTSSGDGWGLRAQRIRARGYEPRCRGSNPSSPTTAQKGKSIKSPQVGFEPTTNRLTPTALPPSYEEQQEIRSHRVQFRSQPMTNMSSKLPSILMHEDNQFGRCGRTLLWISDHIRC